MQNFFGRNPGRGPLHRHKTEGTSVMVSDSPKFPEWSPAPERKIMNLYSTSVFLHVLAAILGLGPLTTLAVIASSPTPSLPAERFAQILRVVGWSLLALLVTGVLIIAQTRGTLGQTGWVRVSFGLFVVLGALHGMVRRRLKRSRDTLPSVALPRGLSPLLWVMCALVAAITYLMEAKPW
jgi:hypothetical protein